MAPWHPVLSFWFEDASLDDWFNGGPDFDARVRATLGELYEQAVSGALAEWRDTADGCLALILLFDQVPRNLFRGEAKAFATDDRAVALAHHAIEEEFDLAVDMPRRMFFYLPLEHSESLENQFLCVTLMKERVGEPEFIDHARRHADVIERFKRFPARNAALGRDSTEEELAFLAENPDGF